MIRASLNVPVSLVWIAFLMLGRAALAFHNVAGSSCSGLRRSAQHHRRLFISLGEPLFPSSNPALSDTSKRRQFLSECLEELNINSESLDKAALNSLQNPANGYDGRYGKSAIRTYRAFLFPKSSNDEAHNEKKSPDIDTVQLKAAASRCARQIEFLLKRHKSHQAEFVRHHDSAEQQASLRTTFPLVLILDNVRSAFNVGSIFRTADAAGCSLVITTGITPHPGGSGAEKLYKSALGAELVVPIRHFTTTQTAINFVREELPGYQLIGMETTEQSVIYSNVDFKTMKSQGGVVLILGNEVTGVDTDIMPMLDVIVQIPMFGAKNSLNVAACAPVVLYEVLRQWTKDEGS